MTNLDAFGFKNAPTCFWKGEVQVKFDNYSLTVIDEALYKCNTSS